MTTLGGFPHMTTTCAAHHLRDAALHGAVHAEALLALADAHLAGVALLLEDLERGQGARVHHEAP